MSEEEYWAAEITDTEIDAIAVAGEAYSVEEQPLNEPEAADAPKWQIAADILLERTTDLLNDADHGGAADISRRLAKVMDSLCRQFDRLDELEHQLAHAAD